MGTYYDIEYATKEATKLAKQIAATVPAARKK